MKMPRPPQKTPAALFVTTLGLSMIGCPAPPAPGEEKFPSVGHTDPDDPRVVRDTDDLYEKGDEPDPPDEEMAPGAGRPDETNGVCRLYAPKLPNPECCPYETGFDVADAKAFCGLQLYMGESMHGTCGYHFLKDTGGSEPVFFRASRVLGEFDKAVGIHEMQLRKATKNKDLKAEPVPGVEGAVWSSANGLNWAHVPGWSNPRLLTWEDGACDKEKMAEFIGRFKDAAEPAEDAEREGLVPARRLRKD